MINTVQRSIIAPIRLAVAAVVAVTIGFAIVAVAAVTTGFVIEASTVVSIVMAIAAATTIPSSFSHDRASEGLQLRPGRFPFRCPSFCPRVH